MSYAAVELRLAIVELFADAARMGKGREFGVLHLVKEIRTKSITDEELMEEARRARPLPRIHPPMRAKMARRPHPLGRGTNSFDGWRRRVATLARDGRCVCVRCGSTSPTHRCPVG